MTALYAVLAVVAVQRLVELALAARNTRHLLARGGVEFDAAGYPLFVLLHAGWFAGLFLCVPADTAPNWLLIALFAALQPVRIWAMAALGRRWTTRLIAVPGKPLVDTGPYRWLRHPNYAVVAAELAILPLAFGAVALAAVCSALNLALLARRIRLEERALARA